MSQSVVGRCGKRFSRTTNRAQDLLSDNSKAIGSEVALRYLFCSAKAPGHHSRICLLPTLWNHMKRHVAG